MENHQDAISKLRNSVPEYQIHIWKLEKSVAENYAAKDVADRSPAEALSNRNSKYIGKVSFLTDNIERDANHSGRME